MVRTSPRLQKDVDYAEEAELWRLEGRGPMPVAEGLDDQPGIRGSEEPAEAAQVSGGKSMKTGFVLARAKLSESSSGMVAVRDRQASLLGKVTYREVEKVAREAPVGSLTTKDMPKRRNANTDEGKARHKEAFGKWMRTALQAKVRSPFGMVLRVIALLLQLWRKC